MSKTTETIEKTETSYTPFIEADADASAEELRALMQEHGYLFFRGLVPVDRVMEVRRDITNLCAEAGWLAPGSDPMEALANLDMEPVSEGIRREIYTALYRKVLKTPSFHDFPTAPALMGVAAKLLQSEVLVHPRRIGRISFPNLEVATTPAHQDHFYIRGAVETYSCWVPLGDCPRVIGGLAVADQSRHKGFLEHNVHHIGATGGSGVPVDEAQTDWHTSDFNAGDALFFHSYTIHKALPNISGNRLRISTDNRYQRPQEDIDPGALRPHLGLE